MGMMGMIGALFNERIGSDNIRIYAAYPAAAVGVTLTSGNGWVLGAYGVYIAAGTITDPSWVVGYILETQGTAYGPMELRIAKGGAGSEVVIALIPFNTVAAATAVGLAYPTPAWLPIPLKVTGSARLAGAIMGVNTATVVSKVIVASGLGT
jgi:hypothetical protein